MILGSRTARPSKIALLVRDSGRTWLVQYDMIKRIPPEDMQLGDVLVVRHATETGVMVMQATRRRGNAWHLDPLGLKT